MGLSAVYLAQRALDAAIEYAGVRKQFGRLIGSTQLVQSVWRTSRRLSRPAAHLLSRAGGIRSRRSEQRSVGDGKRYATNACLEAVSLAMGLHGRWGPAVNCAWRFIATRVCCWCRMAPTKSSR